MNFKNKFCRSVDPATFTPPPNQNSWIRPCNCFSTRQYIAPKQFSPNKNPKKNNIRLELDKQIRASANTGKRMCC